jgi:HlyD family secretion protein
MNAPTLFKIANNLSQMQITAAIDEADIGKIKIGMPVEFTVDAYPNENFEGSVQQIRLNPDTEQNVVSYSVIIDAANPRQMLLPGMTTNVTIVIQSKENVLRIPESATRFRPSKEIWEQMGLKWSDDLLSSARRGGRPAPELLLDGKGAPLHKTGKPRWSVPEAPEQWSSRKEDLVVRAAVSTRRRSTRSKPFDTVECVCFGLGTHGWEPKPVPVRTGISDGAYIEVIEGIEPGTTLVTGVNYKDAKQAAAAGSVTNPTGGPGMGRRF